jgi:hypothetical protein
MDLVTKISSLVACVDDSNELFEWWNTLSSTPNIPRYWKKKGEVAILKSFGSNGTVIDLQPYTAILGTKRTLNITGWLAIQNIIVLVVDPKDLPSDLANPYIILAMSSDVMDFELVINQIKKGRIVPSQFTVPTTIGYMDKYRRTVRFDIPEELE